MHFKDIPSDLMLILVDEYISPDDIEAFSLSCRGVYDIANSRLRKHKKLNESFSSLFVDLRNFCSRGEQWDELYRCWSDPWTARYPKHMHLIAPSYGNSEYERAVIEGGIEDMIQESAPFNRFISPEELGDWRVSANATHDAMAALCLSLLPNLCTFKLEYVGEAMAGSSYDRVTTVLQRVLDPERTRDCRGHLARLENVKLYASEGPMPLMEWFQPFFDLPSMRTINGWNVEAVEGRGQSITTASRNSTVTSIVLEDSLILAKHLSTVLSRLENLQNFTYTHWPHHPYYCVPTIPDPHEDLFVEKEPHQIVNTLIDHASQSLQILHLSFKCKHCAGPIESLKGFSCLNSITLSASLLFRKDNTMVDLVGLLPSTVEYLKVDQAIPSDHEEKPKYQEQQRELLTALSRLREHYNGSLRYQTLGIAKLGFEENNLLLEPEPWLKVISKYTVHPGPAGALRCFKPEEFLIWMECGEGPNPETARLWDYDTGKEEVNTPRMARRP